MSLRFNALAIFIGLFLGSTVSVNSAQAVGRLEQIHRRGLLRVCVWPEYFAISYRNPHTGKLEGFDVDMAKALAKTLGVSIQFVDSSFADLIKNMTNDACDISMHAVGIRPDRAEYMDFSDPVLRSGIYAIASRTSSLVSRWADIDQPGHVVDVLKGTFMEPVMREILKHAHLRVVKTPKQRELDVESGRADVFMSDYPYGQQMLNRTSWAVLLAPPRPLAPTPYAYAVPKGEPEWLARVNAFVRTTKMDGRLAAFAKAHDLSPIVAE
ncbi:substrate-binding periplasmic protein [Rhodospirillum sp. A1_3_36]|uniref:substrate-binding periplasmic protein n=1 Tax=Rhodospirillum sp. A1_3_36 TaxID=3391666 RepID=UPI0039A764B0